MSYVIHIAESLFQKCAIGMKLIIVFWDCSNKNNLKEGTSLVKALVLCVAAHLRGCPLCHSVFNYPPEQSLITNVFQVKQQIRQGGSS